MDRSQRSRLGAGILLILFGGWLLAIRVVPGLERLVQIEMSWPLIVIGVGAFLFILGLLVGAPGMAIPACIVGGIGGILYWQTLTGRWDSWAYVWALIPGFVGVGIVVAGVLGGAWAQARRGLSLILTSLVLFLLFATLMGGMNWLGIYSPLLLVAAGVLLLVRSFFRKDR